MQLTLELHKGVLVARVQEEIETICNQTGQNKEDIFFETIVLDKEEGIGLEWSREQQCWFFMTILG